jgi:hypothetical protein
MVQKLVFSTDMAAVALPGDVDMYGKKPLNIELIGFKWAPAEIWWLRKAGMIIDGLHGPIGDVKWLEAGGMARFGRLWGLNRSLMSVEEAVEIANRNAIPRIVVHAQYVNDNFSKVALALADNSVLVGVENDGIAGMDLRGAGRMVSRLNDQLGERAHIVADWGHFAHARRIHDANEAVVQFCEELERVKGVQVVHASSSLGGDSGALDYFGINDKIWDRFVDTVNRVGVSRIVLENQRQVPLGIFNSREYRYKSALIVQRLRESFPGTG